MSKTRVVTLEVDGEMVATAPSAAVLRATLENLRDDETSFFIVSPSSGTYMQGVLHEGQGIYLEYQAGDLEHHHAATTHFELEEALRIVTAYVSGDELWLEACTWERMEL